MLTTAQPFKPQFTPAPVTPSPSLVSRIAASTTLWAVLSSALMVAAIVTLSLGNSFVMTILLLGASRVASFVRAMVDPYPPRRGGGGGDGGWGWGDGGDGGDGGGG